jgi:hypothetical protein
MIVQARNPRKIPRPGKPAEPVRTRPAMAPRTDRIDVCEARHRSALADAEAALEYYKKHGKAESLALAIHWLKDAQFQKAEAERVKHELGSNL